MDWLEDELRKALAREDPPDGFGRRVLTGARRNVAAMPRWFAAAAALILIAGGGYGYRWHQGMEAKREVMLAFRIASQKVSHVQAVVRESAR